MQNSIAQQVIEIEKTSTSPDFKKIQPLVAGVRGRRVFTEGDKEAGVWTAGQVVGLIDDIPTCEELLAKIEKVTYTHCIITNPRMPRMSSGRWLRKSLHDQNSEIVVLVKILRRLSRRLLRSLVL